MSVSRLTRISHFIRKMKRVSGEVEGVAQKFGKLEEGCSGKLAETVGLAAQVSEVKDQHAASSSSKGWSSSQLVFLVFNFKILWL